MRGGGWFVDIGGIVEHHCWNFPNAIGSDVSVLIYVVLTTPHFNLHAFPFTAPTFCPDGFIGSIHWQYCYKLIKENKTIYHFSCKLM
jgi:hypothetical protein